MTCSVTEVVWTKLPLVPVTVTVEFAPGVLLLVVTVMVVEPWAVTVVGLKLALAPDGKPLVVKLTTPLKLPDFETVIVYVVLLLAVTVRVVGDAESEKSPAA